MEVDGHGRRGVLVRQEFTCLVYRFTARAG